MNYNVIADSLKKTVVIRKKKKLFLTAVATLGMTVATLAQNVPTYVPTNGLVGWWPFNGNANDESGNGYNGTVNGATLSTDRFGNSANAYSFLNAQVIIIPHNSSLNLNSNFALSIWYNPTNVNNPAVDILIKGLNDYTGRPYYLRHHGPSNSNQGIAFRHATGLFPAAPSIEVNSSLPTQNQWHNIIISIEDSVTTLYIDGIPKDTMLFSGFQGIVNTEPLKIGGGYYQYNGYIDDIGIWNRALSQQEITALYNAVNCNNNTAITPQTNALTIGSTATFNATTSDPNPSYVWQSDFGQGFQTLNNFGNYSGANSSTLNIANVQLSEHSQPIRVISTSGNCIDTSNVAVIHVLDTCITNVTVYDTLLTTVTDTLIINTLITGINPPNNSNTIKVFPNPASTHITIHYGNFGLMNGYQLKIENSVGQQVFQTNITQQSDYLSLSTWGGNGLYFVHIIDPQGNTIDIRKIVLQ